MLSKVIDRMIMNEDLVTYEWGFGYLQGNPCGPP